MCRVPKQVDLRPDVLYVCPELRQRGRCADQVQDDMAVTCMRACRSELCSGHSGSATRTLVMCLDNFVGAGPCADKLVSCMQQAVSRAQKHAWCAYQYTWWAAGQHDWCSSAAHEKRG